MKYLVKYVFLFFAAAIFNDVDAQPQDTLKTWTIQDCFIYANEHNIEISTKMLNEGSAMQDLYAAKGSRIPNLYATVGNTFNNANNPSGNEHLVNQLTSSGNYTLNSSITLWNNNYINNTIYQRELQLQSAGLSVQQSRNNITLSITQAYLDILLAKENLKYINDLVSTSASRVAQGQQLYDAGSVAKKELLQLQAQLASDQYLRVQAENAIRQNILALKQILQLPAAVSFDIVTPVSIDIMREIPSLQSVQQAALGHFPEISIGRLGVSIAELDIAKARAAFKPELVASGSLGTGYTGVITNPVTTKPGYFTQAGNNFYQRVGLSVFIPIFSNRINQANLAKANIGYRQAYLNLQNNELLLTQEVERAYLNATNAQQAYEAAGQQLSAAAESYRIANEQSRLGAINSYDLLQQRNQYVQAVQAYTQAKYTALLQQKIYEFYLGNPVTL